jgi:hypothetical protein
LSLDKVKTLSNLANKIIDSIFQLERLDELSKKSTFVAVAHAEAIMLINYVILSRSEIVLEQIELFGFTITAETFPPTFEGKMDALALIFSHVAGKLDATMNAMNASQWMNSMDFIGDIAVAALRGPRIAPKKA